jgi:hypothetical protein
VPGVVGVLESLISARKSRSQVVLYRLRPPRSVDKMTEVTLVR